MTECLPFSSSYCALPAILSPSPIWSAAEVSSLHPAPSAFSFLPTHLPRASLQSLLPDFFPLPRPSPSQGKQKAFPRHLPFREVLRCTWCSWRPKVVPKVVLSHMLIGADGDTECVCVPQCLQCVRNSFCKNKSRHS